MTTDLAIAARLVRGAGRKDIARLLTMCLGVTLAIAAVLVALAVPRALSSATARAGDRLPSSTLNEGPTVGRFAQSTQILKQNSWTRTIVWNLSSTTPLPPGVRRWPAPGHSLVSPALLNEIHQNPALLKQLGVIDGDTIEPAGLTDPRELYSYSTLPSGQGGQSGSPIVGFGGPAQQATSSPMGLVFVELLVLVGVPGFLFLSVCSRLTVTSRRRRLRSLRLIGVSAERCAAIFSRELGLVSGAGAVLGFLAYSCCEPMLRDTGLLGVTWFAGDVSIDLVQAAVLVIATTSVTVLIGRRSMLRYLKSPLQANVQPASKIALVMGVALLLPAIGFLLLLAVKALRDKPDAVILPPDSHVLLTFLAAIAASLGVLLVAPTLIVVSTRLISNLPLPLWIRLGSRNASFRMQSASRVLAATMSLMIVATFATSFLHSIYLDAVGDPNFTTVSLELSEVPTSGRAGLSQLPAKPEEVVLPAAVAGQDSEMAFITVSTCANYRRTAGIMDAAGVKCADMPQRVAKGAEFGDLKPGDDLLISTVSKTVIRVKVPSSAMGIAGAFELHIPPKDAPWMYQAEQGLITYYVSSLDDSVANLLGAIQQIAPGALPEASVKDPASLARYLEQEGIVRTSFAIGFFLCLACFVMSMLDAKWSSERVQASQRAIGMPKSIIRLAASVQFALPLAFATLLIFPVAASASIVFLAFWGAGNGFYAPAVVLPIIFGLIAVTVGMIAGVLSVPRKLNLSLLDSE